MRPPIKVPFRSICRIGVAGGLWALGVSFVQPVAAQAVGSAIKPNSSAEARVTFSNSLAPLPVAAGTGTATPRIVASNVAAVSAAQLATPLDFNVALKMRNLAEFQERVGNGEIVPFEEVESKYLPLPADYASVRAWLAGQGFAVTRDDARRLAIFVRGTPAQIQTSFEVTMQSVTVAGATYTAASTAPSLPATVAGPVLGINGLQPYLQARKHSRLVPLSGLTTNANLGFPYLVPQILKAYDAATLGVAGTTLTGANQKIAIIIDTFPLSTDLTTFWSDNGISQSLSNIEEVNVPNGTLDATGGEETLDVEWSSSIAPGDKVRVYASDNLYFSSIDQCLSQLATDVSGTSPAQPDIHELSISLGIGETYLGVGNSEFTTESQYFVTIANGSTAYGGVTIFVSAGDAGSTPDGSGHSSGGPLQAAYESTDPSVTGVGGTALLVDATTGLRTSEVVWDDTTAGSYYGVGETGGGTSIEFSRPTWQTGMGVPAGTKRLAPDVALVSAGSTPGLLIFNGLEYYVSGTSWASPTWAAFTALINQGRNVNTLARLPLGLLNPRIYPLNGTGNFYDITSGNNAFGANADGNYAATAGYDECTGIGVPDVAVLLGTLLGPTIASFTPTSGLASTSVAITGANFYNVTSVTFNGVNAASYTVNSPNQITAIAPTGVTTGPLGVTALGDTTTSSTNFSVPTLIQTVTTTADAGAGSLRAALAVASSNGQPNIINFSIPATDPGAVGSSVTITLGSPLVPGANDGYLTTIDGGTGVNNVTLSGNGGTQILNIASGVNLTINALNLTRGSGNDGGAISVAQGGALRLTNSAVFNNSASLGGGIYTGTGCALTLTNVTISGNSASSLGGGLYAPCTTMATNCTIANNSAEYEGGVLLDGTGATFTLGNTIIAGNTASYSPDANGNFTSQGYNLIGNASGANGFTATGDQTGVSALLSALGNHGGPTLTHELEIGSPAIDTGNSALTVDQRGLPRPYGAASDIGAYELQPESYTFWASYNFPSGTPAASTGYAADPNGDGIPNGIAQFFGLNPLAPDSAGSVLQSEIQGDNLVLQYPRSITADPTKVFAEASTDLQTWTTAGITYEDLGPASATTELIQAVIPMNGAPAIFGRLHYTP